MRRARCTVIRWIEVGLLKSRQVTPSAPWRILVAKEDIERLKPVDVGKDWLSLKGTARKLGLSQQTVLQKVKSGELEGTRVRAGRTRPPLRVDPNRRDRGAR